MCNGNGLVKVRGVLGWFGLVCGVLMGRTTAKLTDRIRKQACLALYVDLQIH